MSTESDPSPSVDPIPLTPMDAAPATPIDQPSAVLPAGPNATEQVRRALTTTPTAADAQIVVPAPPLVQADLLSTPVKKPYVRLALISFLLLFFELACIRWFGSTVVFLTFFTNIVLIATFLGMSVGLMSASRPTNFVRSVLPLAAVACGLSALLLYLYNAYPGLLMIDVGHQQSPDTIYFGTEYRDATKVIIPMWVIAAVFFTLLALMFVGLGQEMGRAFDAIPNRLAAYTADIIGSLAGIAMFSVLSYSWTSPLLWFAIIAVMMIYLLPRFTRMQAISLLVLMSVVGFTSYRGDLGQTVMWSPYYKVSLDRNIAFDTKKILNNIDTNNIAHQAMANLDQDGLLYPLPHVLNRDAGLPPFDDMLIIGAGSGNDVSAALHYNVKHVDAVEIDPLINTIGKTLHPNHPYDDPRVANSIHYTDGRQWLKRNASNPDNKYDLAVYALVDSLVLHSGYSSLRLESFLFTQEAFADVKANLKPGGVFVMYNFYRQPWVIARLNEATKTVFGTTPLILSFPSIKGDHVIRDSTKEANHFTALIVGLPDSGGQTNHRVEAIRQKFADSQNVYWLAAPNEMVQKTNGFTAKPIPDRARELGSEQTFADGCDWRRVEPATVDVKAMGPVPTDDWPQLYLRDKILPPESIQSMTVIGVLSLILLAVFSNKQSRVPSGRMFFLGAGFMLLECKGVVHLSLLFGATWITNSAVFFAILTMILLANLYVLAIRPKKMLLYYALLFITLALNAVVPMSSFLTLPGVWRPIVSCAVIFVPVFFAGVIFGTSFRDSRRPDADLGWNIAGIIVGALAENFSVVIGFKALIGVAIAFYLLSMLFGRRPSLPAVASV